MPCGVMTVSQLDGIGSCVVCVCVCQGCAAAIVHWLNDKLFIVAVASVCLLGLEVLFYVLSTSSISSDVHKARTLKAEARPLKLR